MSSDPSILEKFNEFISKSVVIIMSIVFAYIFVLLIRSCISRFFHECYFDFYMKSSIYIFFTRMQLLRALRYHISIYMHSFVFFSHLPHFFPSLNLGSFSYLYQSSANWNEKFSFIPHFSGFFFKKIHFTVAVSKQQEEWEKYMFLSTGFCVLGKYKRIVNFDYNSFIWFTVIPKISEDFFPEQTTTTQVRTLYLMSFFSVFILIPSFLWSRFHLLSHVISFNIHFTLLFFFVFSISYN